MIKDIKGQPINPGQIVAFVDAGGGENLPDLCIGKVLNLTKAGVTIQYLNGDYSPVMRRVYDRNAGGYVTSETETKEPKNIRAYGKRYLILEK